MPKKIKNHLFIIPIILTVIALCLIILIPSAAAYNNYLSDKTLSPIYEVNTRIKEIPFYAPFLVNFTLTKFGSDCPPQVAIYIHGYNRDDIEAQEEFNRLQKSMTYNHAIIPLVGFSWDSKVLWDIAKTNAKENGPKLAQYIVDFNNKCPTTKIHVIAHSLGAAVVDTALVILDKNSTWNGKIASVHLLGAVINNKSIANNTLLGNATNNIVEKFYNLYNREDDGLKVNQLLEFHNPLGLVGATNVTTPLNYNDINVVYEIPPFSDADGDGNVE
ncbi:MAG: alpha/beta hydrolase, partial [Nitrososphaerales archaeon]